MSDGDIFGQLSQHLCNDVRSCLKLCCGAWLQLAMLYSLFLLFLFLWSLRELELRLALCSLLRVDTLQPTSSIVKNIQ